MYISRDVVFDEFKFSFANSLVLSSFVTGSKLVNTIILVLIKSSSNSVPTNASLSYFSQSIVMSLSPDFSTKHVSKSA